VRGEYSYMSCTMLISERDNVVGIVEYVAASLTFVCILLEIIDLEDRHLKTGTGQGYHNQNQQEAGKFKDMFGFWFSSHPQSDHSAHYPYPHFHQISLRDLQ